MLPISYIKRVTYPPRGATTTSNEPENASSTTWRLLPNTQGTSESVALIVNPYSDKITHKPNCALGSNLVHVKDPVPNLQRCNVIYQTPCSGCDRAYTGQTGRLLGTWVWPISSHHLILPNVQSEGDVQSYIFITPSCEFNMGWFVASDQFRKLTLVWGCHKVKAGLHCADEAQNNAETRMCSYQAPCISANKKTPLHDPLSSCEVLLNLMTRSAY